jgi:hypothetical protein
LIGRKSSVNVSLAINVDGNVLNVTHGNDMLKFEENRYRDNGLSSNLIDDTESHSSMHTPQKGSKLSGTSVNKERDSKSKTPKAKPFGQLSESDQILAASDPFYAELFEALRTKDVQYRQPSMCGISIDYKKMWEIVQQQGGSAVMTTPKHWRDIGTLLGYPTSNSNIPSFLRKNYQQTLVPLEEMRQGNFAPAAAAAPADVHQVDFKTSDRFENIPQIQSEFPNSVHIDQFRSLENHVIVVATLT